MTDADVQEFITRFAAAWAARDGEAFLALWHPDGVLHSPLYDRPVGGKELGRIHPHPDACWGARIDQITGFQNHELTQVPNEVRNVEDHCVG